MNNTNVFWRLVIIVIFIIMASQILQISGQLVSKLRIDFIGIYTGGYMIAKGGVNNVYDLNSQYFYQQQLISNLNHIKSLLVFLYPPPIALLISLFALFPLSEAYLLWGLFNLLLLGLLVGFIYKIVLYQINEKIKYINPFYFIIMILLFRPIWIAIFQGQFSIILLTIFWLIWYLLKQKQYYTAGLVLSGLILRPHLLIIPLLLFFFKKQWRLIAGFLSGILIVIFITMIVMGPDIWWRYLIFLKRILFIGNNNVTLIQLGFTVRGLLQYFYKTNNIKTVLFPLLIIDSIIVSLLLYFWKGKLLFKKNRFDIQWGLLIMTVILISPHFNYHDVSLLTIPIILILISFINKITVMKIRQYGSLIYWITLLTILSISIIGSFAIIDGFNSLINLTLFVLFFHIFVKE